MHPRPHHVVLSLALAGGCARPAPAPAAADRPLEVVVPTSPATLDPRYSTDAVAVRTTRLVHAGLVRLDPDTLEPKPYAARGWRWIDPLTLEVELRSDVRFHQGKPLAPRDVCETIAALRDPAIASPHRVIVKDVDACEERAPSAVRIHLGAPHATLVTDLELPILRADEARSPPRPKGDLDGLGPYAIARVDEGVVELSPVEGSPLPRPAHAVVVRTVHDENARALRLLAGRADVAPNAISPTLLPALEGQAGLSTRSRPGANLTYLLAQNEHAPFDRPEVRRALAGAIDRALIARTLFAGRAQLAGAVFPPGSMAHPDGLDPPPFDPEAARRVFATAGVRQISLVTSTDRLRITVARAIAQQLGEAGLDVEVMPLDFGVVMQRLASGDFELATLQMPELTEPNLLRWFFHSSSIPSRERPSAGANRARYRSPEVDAWLDAGASDASRDARTAIYAKVARRMAEDMPVVPLWHEDQVAVVSTRAAGFSLSAEGRWLGLAQVP